MNLGVNKYFYLNQNYNCIKNPESVRYKKKHNLNYFYKIDFNIYNKDIKMIIPVRCFTCSKVIGNKYEKYAKLVEEKNKNNNYTNNQDKNIDNDDIFKKLNYFHE